MGMCVQETEAAVLGPSITQPWEPHSCAAWCHRLPHLPAWPLDWGCLLLGSRTQEEGGGVLLCSLFRSVTWVGELVQEPSQQLLTPQGSRGHLAPTQ